MCNQLVSVNSPISDISDCEIYAMKVIKKMTSANMTPTNKFLFNVR